MMCNETLLYEIRSKKSRVILSVTAMGARALFVR